MAKKKKGARRYNPNAPGNGRKLGATIKKQGIIGGPGVFLAKKTGLKGFKTVMPLIILLAGISAVSPNTGLMLAQPVAGIPIAGQIAGLAVRAGASVRAGFG